MSEFKRWIDNILYKRVRRSHEVILTDQIIKGADKYPDPLPGKWDARQLIRHAKEENVDQFVYLEATEMVIERMENEIETRNVEINGLRECLEQRDKRIKELEDILVAAERERVKWANMGR